MVAQIFSGLVFTGLSIWMLFTNGTKMSSVLLLDSLKICQSAQSRTHACTGGGRAHSHTHAGMHGCNERIHAHELARAQAMHVVVVVRILCDKRSYIQRASLEKRLQTCCLIDTYVGRLGGTSERGVGCCLLSSLLLSSLICGRVQSERVRLINPDILVAAF